MIKAAMIFNNVKGFRLSPITNNLTVEYIDEHGCKHEVTVTDYSTFDYSLKHKTVVIHLKNEKAVTPQKKLPTPVTSGGYCFVYHRYMHYKDVINICVEHGISHMLSNVMGVTFNTLDDLTKFIKIAVKYKILR